MAKNKKEKIISYLELANQRAKENKKNKADRLAIELAKIEGQNKRQAERLQARAEELKAKQGRSIANIFIGIGAFVVSLIIIYLFSLIISKS